MASWIKTYTDSFRDAVIEMARCLSFFIEISPGLVSFVELTHAFVLILVSTVNSGDSDPYTQLLWLISGLGVCLVLFRIFFSVVFPEFKCPAPKRKKRASTISDVTNTLGKNHSTKQRVSFFVCYLHERDVDPPFLSLSRFNSFLFCFVFSHNLLSFQQVNIKTNSNVTVVGMAWWPSLFRTTVSAAASTSRSAQPVWRPSCTAARR